MIIAEATSRGVLPLRVMIDNLEFFHIKAQELTGEIMSRLKSSLQVDEELLKLMNSLVNIRMQAQQCAEGAAPYMHPKLANIMLSDDPDNPTATKNIFVLGDNLDEATKAYLKLVGADE